MAKRINIVPFGTSLQRQQGGAVGKWASFSRSAVEILLMTGAKPVEKLRSQIFCRAEPSQTLPPADVDDIFATRFA